MLTPKQKYLVAGVGGILASQALMVTSLFYTSFRVENQATTVVEIMKKNIDKIDVDDLQTLRNAGVLKD